MSSYRAQAPPDVSTVRLDDDYDYKAAADRTPSVAAAEGFRHMQQNYQTPTRAQQLPPRQPAQTGTEALMDLEQLEELQREAERMKALGNKHMASQEYSRAYNAYSAALQLAPVGPSSHVFLSNRAAALLSLKKYTAAATDARRAIALAPTFGKAHARLGQALYFCKDYRGAVAAYNDALEYEPDNQVTKTYLLKAQAKMEKQERKSLGEEVSVAEETQMTPSANSVVTDTRGSDNKEANAILRNAYRSSQNEALATAAARSQVPTPTPSTDATNSQSYPPAEASNPAEIPQPPSGTHSVDTAEDPDFEQALLLQQRANAYLTHKKYKEAIEEYTAALFLVPDDENLSPDLHLGRAHALNGSRRHESARNDARLAIKLNPSPAAYSTLAKSYFYMREYALSIKAFEDCQKLLPEGEELGLFDQAYLRKAEVALEEEDYSLKKAGTPSSSSTQSVVPKLPPPRFVPREQAIHDTPNLPRMPKNWPQQSPTAGQPLQCGPERTVVFLSESLGIQLNRGPDGIVRVLSVKKETAASPMARQGKIQAGDIVREAAGVDLRRPITNIMWGDTVALIKMAPRPIAMVVAQELSHVPASVLDEQRRVASSSSSTDAPVSELVAENTIVNVEEPTTEENTGEEVLPVTRVVGTSDVLPEHTGEELPPESLAESMTNRTTPVLPVDSPRSESPSTKSPVHSTPSLLDDESSVEEGNEEAASEAVNSLTHPTVQEYDVVGGEVIFLREPIAAYCGWDSLRWMSYSGARRVQFSERVYRLTESESKQMFWTTAREDYHERHLIIYEEPNVCLVVRRPTGIDEVQSAIDLPDVANTSNQEYQSFWIVESVVELASAKLRLSTITTPTSSEPAGGSDRAKTCFEVITPVESIVLSAVRVRNEIKKEEQSFSDSGAFLETTAVEIAISKAICGSHEQSGRGGMWKHQLILGTLQSLILSGKQGDLDESIEAARRRICEKEHKELEGNRLPSDIVDALDDDGLTALYYACSLRMNSAVQSLVKAGADVSRVAEEDRTTYTHICARNLDDKSLSIILAASIPKRPNVNALTLYGRTPMCVAAIEGKSLNASSDTACLRRCLAALKAWGGEFGSIQIVKLLAETWRYQNLAMVLEYSSFRFPLPTLASLSAYYMYPLRHTVLSLRAIPGELSSSEDDVLNTITVLLNYGFEPNERIDFLTRQPEDFPVEFIGYSPFLTLAEVASEFRKSSELLDEQVTADRMKCLSSIAEFLVSKGARFNIDFSATRRLRGNKPNVSSPVGSTPDDGQRLPSRLTSSSYKDAISLLGGEGRLSAASRAWAGCKNVSATSQTSILPDAQCVFTDSGAAGGSDEKSCAICWQTFGSILNRRHKCRVSRRYVCDACATKRLINEGQEHRISDGQYLLASVDAKRQENQNKLIEIQKTTATTSLATNDTGGTQRSSAETPTPRSLQAAREQRTRAEEQRNRDSLFGNMIDKASTLVFGENEEEASSAEQAKTMTASLNETRNALLDRGKKLESLGEKSDELVNASSDFARMAKELNRRSQGGFFW